MNRSVLWCGAIGLFAGLAVAVGQWSATVRESPLFRGPMISDLGRRPFFDQPVSFDGVVRLSNATASTLKILDVISGCGCTSVELSSREVPPHADLEVRMHVSLDRVGRFGTSVTLLTSRGEARLHVQAELFRESDTLFRHDVAALNQRREASFSVVAFRSEGMSPEPLRVQAPQWINASVAEWTLVVRASESRPARWEAAVTLRRSSDVEATSGDHVTVLLGDNHARTIRLNGRAW